MSNWSWQKGFDVVASLALVFLTFILVLKDSTAKDVQTTGLSYTSGGS